MWVGLGSGSEPRGDGRVALPGCWRRLFSFLSLLWPPLSFPRAPHPPGLLEPLWGARGVYLTSLAGRSSCSLWHSRSQPSFPAQIWPWHSHRTLSSPRGLPGGRGGRVQSALGCPSPPVLRASPLRPGGASPRGGCRTVPGSPCSQGCEPKLPGSMREGGQPAGWRVASEPGPSTPQFPAPVPQPRCFLHRLPPPPPTSPFPFLFPHSGPCPSLRGRPWLHKP